MQGDRILRCWLLNVDVCPFPEWIPADRHMFEVTAKLI